MPSPLDEYPVHQTPLPMDRVATSDRNFYDRCYLNLYDQSGDVFMVTGLGVYPNLGVIDAYAAARTGDQVHSVRFSDALGDRSLDQQVGGYRIDVAEPLRQLDLHCQSPDGSLDFDLHWTAAFPADRWFFVRYEDPAPHLRPRDPRYRRRRVATAGAQRRSSCRRAVLRAARDCAA